MLKRKRTYAPEEKVYQTFYGGGGATVDPSGSTIFCFNQIAQGTASNQRLKKKVAITEIECILYLNGVNSVNDATQLQWGIVIDKNPQSTISCSDFINTSYGVRGLPNTANSNRFTFLKRKMIDILGPVTTVTGVGTFYTKCDKEQWSRLITIRFDEPIVTVWDNTAGGTYATMEKNAILMYFISTSSGSVYYAASLQCKYFDLD